ncbi:MAG: hypothetical protein AB7L84_13650 [Acidimicrobiia bacterium]
MAWYDVFDPDTTLGTGDTFVAPGPGIYQAYVLDGTFTDAEYWSAEVAL